MWGQPPSAVRRSRARQSTAIVRYVILHNFAREPAHCSGFALAINPLLLTQRLRAGLFKCRPFGADVEQLRSPCRIKASNPPVPTCWNAERCSRTAAGGCPHIPDCVASTNHCSPASDHYSLTSLLLDLLRCSCSPCSCS